MHIYIYTENGHSCIYVHIAVEAQWHRYSSTLKFKGNVVLVTNI